MKKACALAVTFILLFSQVSHAGWIDDWMAHATQETSSPPNFLKTQQRGFGSAGSFSVRWPQSNDYLMNISPPTFKSGCGGIDVFLGGYNFMQPQYLVQKLQGMINAAPAIAFDIALQVISQQVSNSLGKFEAITDRLNALQLDSCKASKAIVAEVAGGLTDNPAIQNYKTTAVQDFTQSSGLSNLPYFTNQTGQTSGTADATATALGTSPNAMVAGCPPGLKNIFFTAKSSITANILQSKGLQPAYADLLRGYIGDIYIDSTGTNYSYVPGCPEDSPSHIEGLIDGQVYTRPLAGGALPPQACTPVTSVSINGQTYPNIEVWVYTVLRGVTQNVISRTTLTSQQTTFLQGMPMPVYQSIVTNVKEEGEQAAASDIAAIYTPSASAAYAYAIMVDLFDEINTAIDTANSITSNAQGSQNATSQNTCHMELAQPAIKQLDEMRRSLQVYLEAARSQFIVKLTELNAYQQYNAVNSDAGKTINDALSKAFPNQFHGAL